MFVTELKTETIQRARSYDSHLNKYDSGEKLENRSRSYSMLTEEHVDSGARPRRTQSVLSTITSDTVDMDPQTGKDLGEVDKMIDEEKSETGRVRSQSCHSHRELEAWEQLSNIF